MAIERPNVQPRKSKKTAPRQGATEGTTTPGEGQRDGTRQLGEANESEHDEPSPVQEVEPCHKKPRQKKQCEFCVPDMNFRC